MNRKNQKLGTNQEQETEEVPARKQVEIMERTAKLLDKKRTREMTETQTETGSTWLMSTITQLINRNEAKMIQHRYIFENTRDAAKKNTKILKQSKYDFERVMQKEEGAMLVAGSEF